MPAKREWTETEDALVRRIGTPRGLLKSEVARMLGCAAWTVHDRMKAIGHRPKAAELLPEMSTGGSFDTTPDMTRDSLPAGHEITWTAIIAGTVLEGARFER